MPDGVETISYRIIGYRVGGRVKAFVSGWRDHVAVYPVPGGALREELQPYVHGKGTLWFALDTPLPATSSCAH
ncbi:hypothetical protein [Tessaracoccus coleopterorum]|uniref:hypothetical protein n=1 Tax=Tessaracoccus coleopterorum TaxID=2714950 RepID=UPI0038CDA33D